VYAAARFLLAAFPLLLLPARALAALRARTLVVLLVGLVAVSSWYNAYVVLIWYRSP
jgi:preprotein translocase subunit SecF